MTMPGLDRSGIPFITAALVPAVVLATAGYPTLASLLAGVALFFAFFFRDPRRTPPRQADAVVAPADGRVLVAGPADAAAPPGRWQQISIFLSPLDVHVNRIPASGRITRVEYRPGRFLPAYRTEAATSNERNEVWIEHNGQTIVCRQVVGILARRIVCRVPEGAIVEAGDRFGIMKFGSRIDLFLPPTATLLTRVGARVRAGETILARL